MSRIPPRPLGTTPLAAFLGAVWDRLWGPDQLIASSPTVKVSKDASGVYTLKSAAGGAATGGTVTVKLCDADTGEEVSYTLFGYPSGQ